jgi:hypothetical protein
MRTSIVVMAAFVVAAFAIGYLAGSVNGVVRGFAANSPQASPTATSTTKCAVVRFVGPHAVGTVSGVSGGTITITPLAGFRDNASAVTQIVTNSSTKFYTGAGTAASLSSVKNGDMVRAAGTLSPNGKSLTATRVIVRTGIALHARLFGRDGTFAPHAFGTVSAIRGNIIKVAPVSRFGTQLPSVATIVTNSSTTFYTGDGGTASISSVKSGDYVIASGTLSADGKTLTATRVFAVNPGALRSHFLHGWSRFAPGQFSGAQRRLSLTL